ncbi:DUF6287 domain-containing protein [Streptococcus sanguinis]|uniref:DUF6287 domain-containing protein n=1 Tax=Streptococcus sanguinis TaxID=1305 RepID=A0A0B7GMH1_STRSA|nr:DUF6287 domain-containing protein [Streptococcus sanguinis]CEL89958.1 conserved lipoprotein of unknown function [Streptococcus sanguinis]
MKMQKLLLTSTTLVASVFLLISCGKQQEKQLPQSSSSSQTVQTSKSDDKSEAKVVQSASQDETDVASASSEAQPKNETKSDTKDPATPAAGIDVNALAAGDFSTVAGTWQNDLGDQFVIDGNGSTVLKRSSGEVIDNNTFYNGRVDNNKYVVSFGYYSSGSSDPLFFIPEGAALPLTGNPAPKEQLQLGSDAITASQHPYYRVSN